MGRPCAWRLTLSDPRDLAPAVGRIRRLLDLDADPLAVAEVLGADPVLAPFVAANPGRRAPGAVDGLELAVRAIAGQQVSVASATAVVARIAATLGTPLAAARRPRDPPLPGRGHARGRAGRGAPGARPRGAPRSARSRRPSRTGRSSWARAPTAHEASARLQAIPGIGPWTAGYVALRALGDPDDAARRRPRHPQGRRPPGPARTTPAALAKVGARWAPWRSYANHHLWASLAGPVRRPHQELDR